MDIFPNQIVSKDAKYLIDRLRIANSAVEPDDSNDSIEGSIELMQDQDLFKSLEGPVDIHCFEERNNVYIIKTLTNSNGEIADLSLFVPLDLDLSINTLLQSDSFNTPTYRRDSKLITSAS